MAWLVGLAVLAENAAVGDLSKTLGLSMSFITAGTVAGPVIAGHLLAWKGYWVAWSVPLVMLSLDLLVWLIITDDHHQHDVMEAVGEETRHAKLLKTGSDGLSKDIEPDEMSPLLRSPTRPAATDAEMQAADGSCSMGSN